MEAMIDSAKDDEDIEIIIVNVMDIPSVSVLDDGNIRYYSIPGTASERYDYKSPNAHKYWREIIEKECPDVIELWGTEMPYGLAALDEARDIPAVVYIQGILESIGRHYRAGMTDVELRKACTIRDILTCRTIRRIQADYLERSAYEVAIVNKAKNVIVENKWAEAYYQKVCPSVKVHWCPLCISQEFEKERWTPDKMRRYTLMCSAANYPIKGLHMLLKALAIVRAKYPEVKLRIPGTSLRRMTSLKARFKQNGYEKFIRNQIEELSLKDSVEYMGRLTAAEMAKKMSESNCFVMCSAIENHSSTLKEAMTVGVPCIASYVGGIPEYAVNDGNCLLYRFEDYEVLAQHIIHLFESQDLCIRLSDKAALDMAESRAKNDFYKISKEIYVRLMKKSNETLHRI